MKQPIKYFRTYLVSLLVVSLLLSTLVIYHQAVNLDEGIHLYNSRQFFSGLKPYRDFYFDKIPLILVAFGLPQKYVAAGIIPGRWYAFCYFFSTLMMLIYLGNRLGGQRAALICGLLMGTRLFTVIGGSLVSTYPPSLFFYTLSFLFLFSSLKPARRWFFTIFFLGLAMQMRQIYLVVLPLYLAAAYAEKKLSVKKLIVIFVSALFLSGLWLIPIFYRTPNLFHNIYSTYAATSLTGLAYLKSKSYWFFDSIRNFFPEIISGLIGLGFYLRSARQRFWHHPHTWLGGLYPLVDFGLPESELFLFSPYFDCCASDRSSAWHFYWQPLCQIWPV